MCRAAARLEEFFLPVGVAEQVHAAQGGISEALDFGLVLLVGFVGLRLLVLCEPEIQLAHVFDALERGVVIVLDPMMAAPYEEAFPVFDIDHCPPVQAAVKLGVADTVLVEIADQFVVGDFELLHGDGLRFCGPRLGFRRASLLHLAPDVAFFLCHIYNSLFYMYKNEKQKRTEKQNYSVFPPFPFRISRPLSGEVAPLRRISVGKDPQAEASKEENSEPRTALNGCRGSGKLRMKGKADPT